MKISLAPLQGQTDYIYRKAFYEIFGGVDEMYTHYIRFDNNQKLKNSYIRDVDPKNNIMEVTIPQVMCNNSDDLLYFDNYLFDLGYKTINWNLGCPFPMVTKKKLGSGLLPHANEINDILSTSIPKLKCKLSVKARLGFVEENELETLIPILNNYPLKELIIHPRVAKQLYKGTVNLNEFDKCKGINKLPLAYNGDIFTIADFKRVDQKYNLDHYMLGRGLLSNPFLAAEIKGTRFLAEEKKSKLKQFHEILFMEYSNKLNGPSHLLDKMKSHWVYLSGAFEDEKKVAKRMRKVGSIKRYLEAVNEIV